MAFVCRIQDFSSNSTTTRFKKKVDLELVFFLDLCSSVFFDLQRRNKGVYKIL